MSWDNPSNSYKQHYKSCSHCWVWARRNLDWKPDEGEAFRGTYLVMECGHCQKLGQILYKWNQDLHGHMPDASKRGFFNVHNRRGCPSRSGKSSATKLEYEYDF